MLNMWDPHWRIFRGRLGLSKFSITVTYRPGLNIQVPGELSRCTLEYRDEAEIHNENITFEGPTSVLIPVQAKNGEK